MEEQTSEPRHVNIYKSNKGFSDRTVSKVEMIEKCNKSINILDVDESQVKPSTYEQYLDAKEELEALRDKLEET